MLISLNWLKQYVEIKETVPELENALTMIGQEVEAITDLGKALENVIVGQIIEAENHPHADKLGVLKVHIGGGDVLQIVCGASNYKVGDKVVVAMIGAVLPKNFEIKETIIRGVTSKGMLCSESELGLKLGNSSGIVILPDEAPLGEEYRTYAKLDDVIFELEITPNRPDCLSHIGIAREIAAYFSRKVKYPFISVSNIIDYLNNQIRIEIKDKNRCKRYMGRLINNVKIKDSPVWLKSRIESMGLKSINNIVDITNFVMFEYNQPMHAFDFDKIEGMDIIVRPAENMEEIVTLEGKRVRLNSEHLVIADKEKPIAIAGIIGGEETQVTKETKNVFLEVAYFDPEGIRKSSKKLGISTESSYRNERGLDIEGVEEALNRAVSLILEIAGGDVIYRNLDKYIEKPEESKILINIERVNKFIGNNLDSEVIFDKLLNLGMKLIPFEKNSMFVVPPSYREDLKRPEDIYEEIIRMYGFDKIEPKMPVGEIKMGYEDENIKLANICKNILSEMGLNEVINYNFIPKEAAKMLSLDTELVEIRNPISEEMAVMRPTLMYSLLTNVRDNLNRNHSDLKFFEVSKTFKYLPELAEETNHIGIAICGKEDKYLWNADKENYDFYDLKGYVETLMEKLKVKDYSITRSKNANFHPGISVDMTKNGVILGTFGEVHPAITEAMEIKKEKVYYGEFDLNIIKSNMDTKKSYKKISKYPSVLRDLSVVLKRDILLGDVIDEIKKDVSLIEKIDVFDIYTGDKIELSKKSVTMNIILRDENKTLIDKEIEGTMTRILEIIETKFGGEIRK